MSSGHWRRRLAERISGYAGSDARAAELRAHLDDSARSGHPVETSDVVSIAGLAAHSTVRRVVRDLPWWLAGLPIAILLFIPLALSYETHFFAWDMIERTPDTATARFWKTAVDVIVATAFVTGLIAGRRCVQHLRQGRFILPGVLLLAVFASGTQLDLFVERTPWWRDGGLRESHIEEVPPYSVALFAAIALIPLSFLVLDLITSRRRNIVSAPVEPDGPIDGRAMAAIVMPLLQFVVSVLWVIPFLALVWTAEIFSLRLKIMATGAIVLPAAGFAAWALLIGDIDDGTAGLLATLGAFLLVWCRLLVVALRPLRALELPVTPDRVR